MKLFADDLKLLDGSNAPNAAVFGNQWRLDKSVSTYEFSQFIFKKNTKFSVPKFHH